MYLVKTLKVLKYLSQTYAVWPLDRGASTNWKILHQLLWWFYFVNYIIAIIFTVNTCYRGRYDVEMVTFSWMEAMAIVEPLIILINYKCYNDLLQRRLNKEEGYVATADPHARLQLKKKSSIFAIMTSLILFLYNVLITLYFTNPVVITTWDTFLTTAYYPSSIRSPATDVLLFAHQLVVMFHTSVMVVFDVVVVTLICECTVRLEVLADRFREAKCYGELIDCIREHHLAKETNQIVRFVALKTVLCFVGYAVGAGLQIVNPKATIVSLERFGVVLLINSVRLVMIALSADDLSRASGEIGSSLYSTIWYEEDRESVIAKRLIMVRCRNIAKISVGGFMPALSLSYITSIISTAISYFTTLRAVTRS